MTKYLLLFCIVFSTSLFAEETNSFEAELRMLEQRDEAAFSLAEEVTNKEVRKEEDMLSDSVSTHNAAVKKVDVQPERSDIVIQSPVVKARRIRSR